MQHNNKFQSLFDEDDMSQLKEKGYFYLKNAFEEGRNSRFKITKEQVDMRSTRDTTQTIQHLNQGNIRSLLQVLTIHGSNDEIVPVENAHKFDRELGHNHILHIIDGAGHNFNGIKYHATMVKMISSFLNTKQNKLT
jgi:pimeloyl-ACP methyl ester carboxylesterase